MDSQVVVQMLWIFNSMIRLLSYLRKSKTFGGLLLGSLSHQERQQDQIVIATCHLNEVVFRCSVIHCDP